MKNDLYRIKPNASGANNSSSFGRAGTPKDVPYVGIEIRKATAEDLGTLLDRVYEANEPAKQFWKSNGLSSHQVILQKDGATANASGANTAVGFGRAGTPKD